MLPFRCSSSAVCLVAALGLAASAEADWSGSLPDEISILLDGAIVHIVDSAADVQPDDAMYRIYWAT